MDAIVAPKPTVSYPSRVAVVYIAALFLQIMDGTIINVALPTLADAFEVSSTQMDWTVLAFATALGVMTASAGWFSDRFGARRVFLFSLVGFVATSVICGAAQSLDQLVVGRALQGACAGTITPVGSTLLFNAFPIEERSVASRKVVTVAVIAPALGPVLGGAIIEVTSWRWIFFVNVPVGLVALALGATWLRTDEPVEAGRFDSTGFALLVSGFALSLFGLSRGGEQGWGTPRIWLSLTVGVVLLAALAVVELRKRDPLLALDLLRDRIFRTSIGLALPVYAGFFSLLFLLPLYLQDEGGRTALEAGLAMFPQPLGVLVMTQIAGRYLYKPIGPRRLIVAGSLGAMVIGLAFAALDPTVDLWALRGLMFVRGLSMGLVFVPLQAAVYAQMAPMQMSRATAIFGVSRQLSPAIGVAVASTVLAAGLAGTSVGDAARVDAFQTAMVVSAALFAVGAVVGWRIRDSDAAATMA